MADKQPCRHEVLVPRKHPDGPVVPACVACGKFVVRGELHLTVPLNKRADDG